MRLINGCIESSLEQESEMIAVGSDFQGEEKMTFGYFHAIDQISGRVLLKNCLVTSFQHQAEDL